MILTIITAVLAYLAIGFMTSFVVLYLAYKKYWDTDDRRIMGTLSFLFWPLFGPFITIWFLVHAMDAKAEELALK